MRYAIKLETFSNAREKFEYYTPLKVVENAIYDGVFIYDDSMDDRVFGDILPCHNNTEPSYKFSEFKTKHEAVQAEARSILTNAYEEAFDL